MAKNGYTSCMSEGREPGGLMEDTYDTLVAFVNAAADLAESLESDLKAGDTISDATVVKLSRFYTISEHFRPITDNLKKLN